MLVILREDMLVDVHAYSRRSHKQKPYLYFDLLQHRFNRSRESAIGDTTAFDAEAWLLDIVQADFLALLGAFK